MKIKIKIIKGMLSVLLTISSLATATFCVRAENGDRKDLENKISECDEIIAECNETILDFEKEKDNNIKSINNDLKALDEIKKILDTGEILECELQDLENRNRDLIQKIEHINENYQNNVKLALETKQQQINKKSELKKKLDEIPKISKQNVNDLIKKSENLNLEFRTLPTSDRSKLDRLSRVALINFSIECRDQYQNLLSNEDEFNKFQAKFNDLKAKVDAIRQNKKSPNKFENLQAKSGASDQHQKNIELWKKINSGSQCYKPDHVANNLCWLHSATNVRNYYDNMKNQETVKGQTKVVEKYKQIMGDQAAAKNINGKMREFDQISEYLEKCSLGNLQMIISSSSKNAQQKVKNTAKELLQAHFNKTQNTSPVISHTGDGDKYGHFITIADYDQNQDQFLIVDSSTHPSEPEAKVEWKKSEEFLQALTKKAFCGEYMLKLDFTSNVSRSRSIILAVNEDNSIVQRDLATENAKEIQTSIYVLKNMIKQY